MGKALRPSIRSSLSGNGQSIYIVEPDAEVRTRIFRWANQQPGRIILSYADGLEFLQNWHSGISGLVLVAENAGSISGMDVIQTVAGEQTARVILMVENPLYDTAVKAMRAGAVDCALKPLHFDDLKGIVESALAEIADVQELELARRSAELRLAQLSVREREIAQWIADGASNKDIARALDLSVRTVEVHRANLMRRTGLESVAGLVRTVMLGEGVEREPDTQTRV